jgi:hypothetical protein
VLILLCSFAFSFRSTDFSFLTCVRLLFTHYKSWR